MAMWDEIGPAPNARLAPPTRQKLRTKIKNREVLPNVGPYRITYYDWERMVYKLAKAGHRYYWKWEVRMVA